MYLLDERLIKLCVGVCQRCGTRFDLEDKYLNKAVCKFDHKEADNMKRLRQRAYEYIMFKKNLKQHKRKTKRLKHGSKRT